uniref:Tc1-like transposase DDE domain-containing protein n=1 Tax=Sphaeramia orbicularis TaxID=375764 RepID=A0A673ADV1_9TELE
VRAHVAQRLGCGRRVIDRLAARYRETGQVVDRPRSGHPRVTTQRQDAYIVLSARHRNLRSASRLRDDLQTTRNRLHARGIHARRPVVRPVLTRQHVANRLAWCRTHLHWTMANWRMMVFSDESRFMVTPTDGRARVWWERGQRYVANNVLHRDRWGAGSVMVWGAIWWTGRSNLIIVHGNLNGHGYIENILRPEVARIMRQLGPKAVFQDDNARPHRSSAVDQFFEDEGINHMDWPARSPDLNPIEHLWDMLDRQVRSWNHQLRSVQELTQWIQEEWRAIPHQQIQTLIGSMRRRCTAVIDARGRHSRY